MAPDEIRTVLIPNRTFLVRFGSISGSFGLTMGILARLLTPGRRSIYCCA